MPEAGTYAATLVDIFGLLLLNPNGVTSDQVAKHLGCCRRAAARNLRALNRSGWLDSIYRGPGSTKNRIGQFNGELPGGRKVWFIKREKLLEVFDANRVYLEHVEIARGLDGSILPERRSA